MLNKLFISIMKVLRLTISTFCFWTLCFCMSSLSAQSTWSLPGISGTNLSSPTHRSASAFVEGGSDARGFGIENPFNGIQTASWWGNLSFGMSVANHNLFDLTQQNRIPNTWTRPVVLSGTYGVGISTQHGRITIGQNGIMTIGLSTAQSGSIARINNPDNQFNLYVSKGIRTEELWIDLKSNWPDYVFEVSYKLPELTQLATEIEAKGHLPNVPSAEVVEAEGFGVSEMTVIQQEKIEELYLYVIQLHERVEILETENKALKATNTATE